MAAKGGLEIPDALAWLDERPDGKLWLSRLPDLYVAACERFAVIGTGRPFTGGCVSYVVPVHAEAGDAVLKIQFIDRESRFEADALKAWNGNGAIRLVDHAPDLGAMLLERCLPGRFLADDHHTDQIGVMADLLRKLHIPAWAPFRSLREEADDWREGLSATWERHGRPCEKRLVDAAVSALCEMTADETPSILLHQDLHGHNVLSSERSGWLAIDPKPLAGDPAFSLSPIVRSFELGHSRQEALRRLDRLSAELDLDRERARLWTIGQTMAWGFGSDYSDRHFETVRWLLGPEPR
ncbi:aminoglycoside phosphotransferase [Rhodobacterales bacterium]|nr:aminoglycoside phosphotransferase [Rhodobacterales bacterium]